MSLRILIKFAALCLVVASVARASDPVAPLVEAQFDTIKRHGVALGFYPDGMPDVSGAYHWQGIARSNTPGEPHLFVTASNANAAALGVVRMTSCARDGERLRSNRLSSAYDVKDTAPPTSDKVVKVIRFDGTNYNGGDGPGYPHYHHAGGIQISGDILAVSLEDPGDASLSAGAVCFIDVADPQNPIFLSVQSIDHDVGAVAIISQGAGAYLVAVMGWDTGRRVGFYSTTESLIRNPPASGQILTHLDDWYQYDNSQVLWQIGTLSLQNINFIKDSSSGSLYLIGTRNTTGAPGGNDYADIYRVTTSGSEYYLTHVNTNWIRPCDCYDCNNCPASHTGRFGNGAAAGGIYVSPTGNLYLYMTEHYSDGPGNSVKMGEFYLSGLTWSGNANPCTYWVELYDDATGWDDGTPDRSMVIDGQDRFREDFANFNNLEGFNDKASSVRWCLPVGVNVVLYENDTFNTGNSGRTVTLTGTGRVQSIANLADSPYNFGDKTSSLAFYNATCVEQSVAVVPEQAGTIAGGADLLTGCCERPELSVFRGGYPGAVTLTKSMIIRTREGAARIGAN